MNDELLIERLMEKLDTETAFWVSRVVSRLQPRVFVVTDTIGGCSGEHWYVVVAKNEEHAEELAHEEWSKVSTHAETRVEEILVDTEGVKDYGGYIE